MVEDRTSSGVFVSYRRSDASTEAGRIAEALVRRIGADRVFVDVTTLRPGEEFRAQIEDAVARSAVFVAIIGPSWLTAADEKGDRRLDAADDVVRAEVAAALRTGRVTIPVLVRGANMPASSELPQDLKALADRHAASIDDERWDYDVQRLVRRIEETFTTSERSPAPSFTVGVDASGFVGRDGLVADVERSLDSRRLVTLTGAGGTGKTRLAHELVARFTRGRTVFVDLTGVRDPALVAVAIANAVGLVEVQAGEELIAVARVLGTEPSSLLALDNCEHLLDACVDACRELLTLAPTLAVLATSREPLSLEGESVVPVPPLALPEVDDADGVIDAPSSRLFLERARTANPAFTLDASTAPHVASICRQVDGIPLAIELAAARVRGMGVADVDSRLAERLDLLAGSTRGGDPRHRTMVDTLDWSYGLLEPDEARLLDRASVFEGGFDLEAAEAVCGGDGLDVLLALPSLVDRSLVTVWSSADGMRYRLLEPVRQYAAGHLQSERSQALSSVHARYFADLLERAEPQLRGPDQLAWQRRWRDEVSNVRSAVSWSLDHDPTSLGRIVAASWWVVVPVSVTERRGWAGAAVGMLEQMDLPARAGTVGAAAIFAYIQGDREEALRLSEQGIELDTGGHVTPMVLLIGSTLARARGQLDEAEEIGEEAIASTHDPWWVARAIHTLGLVDKDRGDSRAARERLSAARDRFLKLGDEQSAFDSSQSLGLVAISMGDIDEVQRVCDELADLVDTDANPDAHVDLLTLTCDLSRLRGDFDRARVTMLEAFELMWIRGYFSELPGVLRCVAAITVERAGAALALSLLGAAVRWAEGSGVLEQLSSELGRSNFTDDPEATRDAAVALLTPDEVKVAWRRGLDADLEGVRTLMLEALATPA